MAWKPASGERRCAHKSSRTGKQCRLWGIAGTEPPTCQVHGGSAPQVRAAAGRRVQERQALVLAGKMNVDPGQFDGNPVTALQDAMRRQQELAHRLGCLLAGLEDGSLRYRGPVGEQLHGWLTAAQAAFRDQAATADKMLRLRHGDRALAAREATAVAEAKLTTDKRDLLEAIVTALNLAVGDVLADPQFRIDGPTALAMADAVITRTALRLRALDAVPKQPGGSVSDGGGAGLAGTS